MSEDEKEFLDIYQKLEPENKANVSAYARVALSAQETTKKELSSRPVTEEQKISA
jgi:hypothetical protein